MRYDNCHWNTGAKAVGCEITMPPHLLGIHEDEDEEALALEHDAGQEEFGPL